MTKQAMVQSDNIVTVQSPDRLIELAIQQPNFDINALEKLMALKERYEAAQAKKLYDQAISKFQSLCPVLKKTKEIKYNNVAYSYTPLSSIREQIQAHLHDCGLAYRWTVEDTKDEIRVTCVITHIEGHSEKNTISAGLDDSGAKNEIQQRGSTISYLQRYTLIGALGISSANDDDDGQSSGAYNIDKLMRHNTAVRENYHSLYVIKEALSTNDLNVAAEAFCEMDRETKDALWVAPTKGGIFTTKEREILKSHEFGQAMLVFEPEGDIL